MLKLRQKERQKKKKDSQGCREERKRLETIEISKKVKKKGKEFLINGLILPRRIQNSILRLTLKDYLPKFKRSQLKTGIRLPFLVKNIKQSFQS